MSKKLSIDQLRLEFDSTLLRCETTEELTPLEGIIGQERAVRALRFGLDIKEKGFNIYAAGYPGTGRTTAVQDFLKELAKVKSIPSDWCYVNNFTNSYEPLAIELPSGKGKEFAQDMKEFIEEVRQELPKTFESDDYASKRDETIQSIEIERRDLFNQMNERVQKEGFLLQITPMGILIVPMIEGRPLKEEEILSLSPPIRAEIQKRRDGLRSELRSAFRQLRGLEKKANEEIKNVNREVALFTIGHLVSDLVEKYDHLPTVKKYINDVREDILENLTLFIQGPQRNPQMPFQAPWMMELPFRKYEVNVAIYNSETTGAPVIVELNPTYQHLFGRIEKEAQFGVLTTDFTMIRGGSLHKANGGYLVIPAEDLVRNLFSYESIKRALKNDCIRIEEPGERLGYITTKGLRPAPIPLSVKIILIGHPYIYQQLLLLDMEFRELFKVKADFDVSMDRTEENIRKYASFICTFCQKDDIHHLDVSAVAKIMKYGSRLAADRTKLSTRFAEVADIIREANFYANQNNASNVSAQHVTKAIEEKIYRSNLVQERIREMIERGTLLIDTEGKAVGQVNGLSVMSLGDFSFGAPSRVTASIGLGRESIIDIQREARLGGPIHTKGVLILSGYLTEQYAQDKPLSLSTRLVFEQSYGMVEGDSASSTELYAILSALSESPIRQDLAVTGSVNQKGDVQAIGGVNEKIEGFFEVCKANGLTGTQGVLIPQSNVQNLVLKDEVIQAVQNNQFHIYPISTINEGIEVLTGLAAGTRQADGTFEKDTINHRVNQKLKQMAERLKEFPHLTK
ncbi:MAG: AAA family ATPase [Candidatus Bathyarchaeota archaeon]|nr:AAA family ATPase [Candidatus Bathyarchaeota archaeon]